MHIARFETPEALAPGVDRLFADPVPLRYRRYGSRSASRMIATICSSVNRPFRMAPSESGASLSTNRWPEYPATGYFFSSLRTEHTARKTYRTCRQGKSRRNRLH
jgi:hypothetical protein